MKKIKKFLRYLFWHLTNGPIRLYSAQLRRQGKYDEALYVMGSTITTQIILGSYNAFFETKHTNTFKQMIRILNNKKSIF